MNLVGKSFMAIKNGVFFEKLYIYLFIRKKIYKLFDIIFSRRKINRKKIVFVNYYGAGYGDSSKAIVDYIIENNLDYELVWLLDKRKDDGSSLPKQVKKVAYFSIKSLNELSTAKIWIDNCRKEYFPRKKTEQIYIQTWHGALALKKIEADAPSLSSQYTNMARQDSKNIDVILNGYNFMTNIFKNSFWYSGPILNIGTPRSDIFFDEKKIIGCKQNIFELYRIDSDTKVLLYAPTFRQGHNLGVYRLEYLQLKETLERKFSKNWKILVRLHPNLHYLASDLALPETVINVTTHKDMQELLCASDIVITDYSSLMFDFFILKRPVFLYCPDFDEYTGKDREFYFNMQDLPFSMAQSNKELCDIICSFDFTEYLENIKKFKNRVGVFENGTACSSLFNWLENQFINKKK